MAQMQASRPMGAQTGPEQGNAIQKLTNLMGAGLSVALVITMAIWGYKMLSRDVSGVPVVKAAQGPMRVQPDNPGGQQAQHQGLAVNDVAADGTAADPADRLVLAPEPLDLTFEEAPAAAPQETAAQPADPDAEMLALAEALAEGVEPLEELQPVAATVPQATVSGGLGKSLRPRLRPTTLASVQPTAAAPVDAGTTRDVDAASIPVGTRLAQLGAFKTEEIARAEWARLEGKFGDYLDGKDRVIQKAESGGRTFYRLRAMGFADLGDARRFCSALVAERAECIPVVTR